MMDNEPGLESDLCLSEDYSTDAVSESENNDESTDQVKVAKHFYTAVSGFQPQSAFEQDIKATNILSVVYNSKLNQYAILDVRGITMWSPAAVNGKVRRALTFPKYEYRTYITLIYCKEYSVYFALNKDYTIVLLNREFAEASENEEQYRNTTFMIWNSYNKELITGGSYGIKIWHFEHTYKSEYSQTKKSRFNYELILKNQFPNVGGSWVKEVDIEPQLNYLFCMADISLYCYDLRNKGATLFQFKSAHRAYISGCVYSQTCQLLVTASHDAEIRIWHTKHGNIGTLMGHTAKITKLLLYPDDDTRILTASRDGSVRMWSIQLHCCLLNVQAFPKEGVYWMEIAGDGEVFVASPRRILSFKLNFLPEFWAEQNMTARKLFLAQNPGQTTRVVSLGNDSSICLYSRRNQKLITLVLTPPNVSPLSQITGATYCRAEGIAYLLLNSKDIWIYSCKSNPACRVAVWKTAEMQLMGHRRQTEEIGKAQNLGPSKDQVKDLYRCKLIGSDYDTASNCCSITFLRAPDSGIIVWTDEGEASVLATEFLLLGLEDGRVIFMDPVEKTLKYLEMRVSRSPVLEMQTDSFHDCLLTRIITKAFNVIQIWQLPRMHLVHEVFCPLDLTGFCRLHDTLLTAHSSGHFYLHNLEVVEDTGPNVARAPPFGPDYYSDLKEKPDHSSAIISVDCSHKLSLFCTCGSDGMIKLWTEDRVLLSEVMLEMPISNACFLNSCGDMILSLMGHLYKLAAEKLIHPKALATLNQQNIDYEDSARLSLNTAESICMEDSEIKVDMKGPMQFDPINLRNYLNPFNLSLISTYTPVEFGPAPMPCDGAESSVSQYSGRSLSDVYPSSIDSPLPESISDASERALYEWTNQVKKNSRLPSRTYTLPKFGMSPGPSPTLTPQSSATVTPVHSDEEEELSQELKDEEKHGDVVSVAKDKTTDTKSKPDSGPAPILRPERSPLSGSYAIDPNDVKPRGGTKKGRPISKPSTKDSLEHSENSQTAKKRQSPVKKTVAARERTKSKSTVKSAKSKSRPEDRNEESSTAPSRSQIVEDGGDDVEVTATQEAIVSDIVRAYEEEKDGLIADLAEEKSVDTKLKLDSDTSRQLLTPMKKMRSPFQLATPKTATTVRKTNEEILREENVQHEEKEKAPPMKTEDFIQVLQSMKPEELSQMSYDDLVNMGMGQEFTNLLSGRGDLQSIKLPDSLYQALMLKYLQKYAHLLRDHPYMMFKNATHSRGAPEEKIKTSMQETRPKTAYEQLQGRWNMMSRSGHLNDVPQFQDFIRFFGHGRFKIKGHSQQTGEEFNEDAEETGYSSDGSLRKYSGKQVLWRQNVSPTPTEEHSSSYFDEEGRPYTAGQLLQNHLDALHARRCNSGDHATIRDDSWRGWFSLWEDASIGRHEMTTAGSRRTRTRSSRRRDRESSVEMWSSEEEEYDDVSEWEKGKFETLRNFYQQYLQKMKMENPDMPWDRLLQNDGIRSLTPLDQIQRHTLNKIGRQLRYILTRDRRQVENQWLEQRRRGLKGHRYCSHYGLDPDVNKRESQSRANQMRSRTHSHSNTRSPPPLSACSRLARGGKRSKNQRSQLFYCEICAEVHNQKINNSNLESEEVEHSRPLTSSPEPQGDKTIESESMPHLSDEKEERSFSAGMTGPDGYLRRPETAYRLASREKSAPPGKSNDRNVFAELPKSAAAIQKPSIKRSASSIPGKSRNYILVHRNKSSHETELPEPTMMEERLIRRRFPQLKHRWLPKESALTAKPWLYHLYEGQSQI